MRRVYRGLQRPHRADGACAFIVHARMSRSALLGVNHCLPTIALRERRDCDTYLNEQHEQRRTPALPMRYATQEAVQSHLLNSTACVEKALTCPPNCAYHPDIARHLPRLAARAARVGQGPQR